MRWKTWWGNCRTAYWCDFALESEGEDAQDAFVAALELAERAVARGQNVYLFVNNTDYTFCWIAPSEEVVQQRLAKAVSSFQ